MDSLSQAQLITSLGLLKYVFWFILSVHLFSWHYFRMLPTLGDFSSGERGPFRHDKMKASCVLAVFPGTCSLYLLTPMGMVSLRLRAVIPLITTASLLPL